MGTKLKIKIQGLLSTSVKFLGVWCMQRFFPSKLFHLPLPPPGKKHNGQWAYLDPIAAYSLLGVLLQPMYQTAQKATSFKWDLEQKALEQAQTAVQAALLLGPYIPADPMVLEASMVDKDAVWNHWQGPKVESQRRPLEFWIKDLLSYTDNHSSFQRQPQWKLNI